MPKPVENHTETQPNVQQNRSESYSTANKLAETSIMSGRHGNTRLNHRLYGPMAYNPRLMGALQMEMGTRRRNFENINITEDDKHNLIPLAERIHEYRILGWRVHSDEEVTSTIKNSLAEGNGSALYVTYCKEYGGLKNPKAKASFENLKNPEIMIKNLMDVSVGLTPDANEDIDLLTEIAIKENNYALAACLLEGTQDSKTTFIGADRKTAQKLLLESRKMFNSDDEYYSFISNTDKAYQKLFPGKSLNKYIEHNYKPLWQRPLPLVGAIAGAGIAATCLSFAPVALLAVGGAAAGGFIGKLINSSNFFGKSEKGNEIIEKISEARNKNHRMDNPEKYMSGMHSGRAAAMAVPY